MTDDTSGDAARPENDADLPNPSPRGVAGYSKTSLIGLAAIAEFNLVVGYDIREVMRDEWWKVGDGGDGRADVLLTADGARAMARFAPRADAPEVVERVIAKGRAQR